MHIRRELKTVKILILIFMWSNVRGFGRFFMLLMNYLIFFCEIQPKWNFFWWTNQFWCEFLVYILITLFSSLLFFQQAGSMPGDALWAGSQWDHGCHPSYLKTVSQQVVCRIRTHSLRFSAPNTAILVGIMQIHTNFGCLKWLVKMVNHQKILYLGTFSLVALIDSKKF